MDVLIGFSRLQRPPIQVLWPSGCSLYREALSRIKELLCRFTTHRPACSLSYRPGYELRRARFNTPFLFLLTVCLWMCVFLCVCVSFFIFKLQRGGRIRRFLRHSPFTQTNHSLQLIKGIWPTWTFRKDWLEFSKKKSSAPIHMYGWREGINNWIVTLQSPQATICCLQDLSKVFTPPILWCYSHKPEYVILILPKKKCRCCKKVRGK